MSRRSAMVCHTMPDMLAAVNARLKKLGWSRYRLVQELKGRRPDGTDVPAASVYEFLRGDSTINSRDLGLIFDVIGLDVTGGGK